MTKVQTISYASIALLVAVSLFLSSTALAKVNPERMPEQGQSMIPAHAIAKAPGLFYLGETFDEASAGMVEGYMFVTPHRGNAKPEGKGGKGGGKPDGGGDDTSTTASCYGLMGKGVKWKSLERWEVDPRNNEGLNQTTVFDILSVGIRKWEDAVDGVIDGNETNIFGEGSVVVDGSVAADTASTDNRNEVLFGDLDAGIIGVTIVWGYFNGPLGQRQIVEWDQVYNTDFAWDTSITGISDAMDFESIATHELGHAMGLADLYDTACQDMTMYGYGNEGLIHARSLEDGDINGISSLY